MLQWQLSLLSCLYCRLNVNILDALSLWLCKVPLQSLHHTIVQNNNNSSKILLTWVTASWIIHRSMTSQFTEWQEWSPSANLYRVTHLTLRACCLYGHVTFQRTECCGWWLSTLTDDGWKWPRSWPDNTWAAHIYEDTGITIIMDARDCRGSWSGTAVFRDYVNIGLWQQLYSSCTSTSLMVTLTLTVFVVVN